MRDEQVTDVLNAQLPEYFRPVVEFQEILKACGYLLQQIETETARMRNNFYIASCDWRTIDYYEKLLGISGAKGLPLEERRSVVLMRYGMRPLYTLPMLKGMLRAAAGADRYSVICLPEECRLTVILKEQDTGKVREIYDTVALLRPAHVQLFFKAEYVGESELTVKTAASVRFRANFYPRFNLPRLCLNGKWKLDGSRRLSGYDTRETMDLYPVSIRLVGAVRGAPVEGTRLRLYTSAGEEENLMSRARFFVRSEIMSGGSSGQRVTIQAKAAELPEEHTGLHLRERVQKKIENETALSMSSLAECKTAPGWKTGVRASAAHKAEAGGVTVYNQNRLEGGWKLNGSRKLNGGMESR